MPPADGRPSPPADRHRLGPHACAPARPSPAGLNGGGRSAGQTNGRPSPPADRRPTAHTHTHTRTHEAGSGRPQAIGTARPAAGHHPHPCTRTRKDRSHSATPPQPATPQAQPNARTRSNTRARANTPSLCPSPKRRRVLLATGGSFAGSRAQKLVRYDTKIAFPAARAGKMEGGQKIGAGQKGRGADRRGLVLGAGDLCIPIWNRARA